MQLTGAQVEVLAAEAHQRQHAGQDRDRQEGAEDTPQGPAGRHPEQHDHRVHRHDPAVHHRRHEGALRLLHGDDDEDDPQRGDPAVGHQGDQDGQAPGHEGAHDGDEGQEEGDDRQGEGQRHTEEHQPQADEEGVHRRDHGLGAQEPAEGHPDPGQRLGQVEPGAAPHRLAHPGQEAVPVLEEEEGEHQDEDRRDHDRADRREGGQRALGQHAGARLQPVGGPGHVGVELVALQVDRWPGQPGEHQVGAGRGVGGHLAHLSGDAGGDRGDDAAEDRQRREEHRRRREAARPPVPAEPAHRRPEDRADDEGQDDGQHTHPHAPEGVEDDHDGRDDEQEPPGPGRGTPQALQDQRAAVDLRSGRLRLGRRGPRAGVLVAAGRIGGRHLARGRLVARRAVPLVERRGVVAGGVLLHALGPPGQLAGWTAIVHPRVCVAPGSRVRPRPAVAAVSTQTNSRHSCVPRSLMAAAFSAPGFHTTVCVAP